MSASTRPTMEETLEALSATRQFRVVVGAMLSTVFFFLSITVFTSPADARWFALFWKLGCITTGWTFGLVAAWLTVPGKITMEMSDGAAKLARAIITGCFVLGVALGG